MSIETSEEVEADMNSSSSDNEDDSELCSNLPAMKKQKTLDPANMGNHHDSQLLDSEAMSL